MRVSTAISLPTHCQPINAVLASRNSSSSSDTASRTGSSSSYDSAIHSGVLGNNTIFSEPSSIPNGVEKLLVLVCAKNDGEFSYVPCVAKTIVQVINTINSFRSQTGSWLEIEAPEEFGSKKKYAAGTRFRLDGFTFVDDGSDRHIVMLVGSDGILYIP